VNSNNNNNNNNPLEIRIAFSLCCLPGLHPFHISLHLSFPIRAFPSFAVLASLLFFRFYNQIALEIILLSLDNICISTGKQ